MVRPLPDYEFRLWDINLRYSWNVQNFEKKILDFGTKTQISGGVEIEFSIFEQFSIFSRRFRLEKLFGVLSELRKR